MPAEIQSLPTKSVDAKNGGDLSDESFRLQGMLPKRKASIDIDSRLYTRLGKLAREFVLRQVAHCQPDRVHICDGSEEEYQQLLESMQKEGMIEKLPKYENCWLVRTDPRDVARVEEKTYICTDNMRDAVPIPKEGVQGHLGKWMDMKEFDKDYEELFRACMHGRVMYVIPFSMGPIGGPLSKIGIEITDSPYVVACMRIMTRAGTKVLEALGDNDFVKALHSVGQPLPMSKPPVHGWPCNPEHTVIAQIPSRNEIISFGSGYGGNSLLGKKCFALRIGCCIARREGWLAEHMLIFGITNPQGKKHYIAAAFPSCCGKTNLAMLRPALPGYKIECVGDDIAWMKFDAEGQLRGINPESGFFGVAPGTNEETNPNAMATFRKDTIFTNVAKTEDGGYYWEGMPLPDCKVEDWLCQPWEPGCGRPAAHPNARFTSPADHCPIIDPLWEDPRGVPIDAILFGGRRPEGIPLVYEAFDWKHGVFCGATVRSEATKAAEDHGKEILHDPFAMRPFFGYNFGKYVEHWLTMKEQHPNAKLPKIFHVNWFRKDKDGKFMWPGFGDNIRVLDWIMKRCDGEDIAEPRPFGLVPKPGTVCMDGLDPKPSLEQLTAFNKDFWTQEVAEMKKYFEEQCPLDTPQEVWDQIAALEKRISEA